MRTDDRTAAFANFVSGENSLCTTVSISRFHIVSRGVEIEKGCQGAFTIWEVVFFGSAICYTVLGHSLWYLRSCWRLEKHFPFIYICFLLSIYWHRVFGLKGKLVRHLLLSLLPPTSLVAPECSLAYFTVRNCYPPSWIQILTAQLLDPTTPLST